MTKVGFCGISGSGMSSLAQILKLSGYEVCGSDRNFDLGRDLATKEKMEKIGINIYPQDGSWIDNSLKWLCASTAVEDTIPDVKVAKEKNVTIMTRPQLLADTFHSYRYGIAVGGTSGKTTTTAMIGYILDKAGKNPCMINGGLLCDYEGISAIPNIIYNKGDICVVEADESNGSIDLYNPYISLVTNISVDHKSIDELKLLFQNFANRAGKSAVINDDYEYCRNLEINKATVRFSTKNPQADFYAHNLKPLPHGIQYELDGKTYTLNLIGEFNVANALAAIAVCSEMGVDKHTAAAILQNFHGTKRRLEVIGQKNNITVIDDFAHNPDKIKASVRALRQYDGRLIIMFQPHGFAPMRLVGKEIMEEFVKGLNDDDILIMPEIFFVGGSAEKDISSANLIDYAKQSGKKNAYFAEDKTKAKEKILQLVKSGDRIVIMGARDTSLPDLCRQILEEL